MPLHEVPPVHLLHDVVRYELALYGLVGNLRGAVRNGILPRLGMVFLERKNKSRMLAFVPPLKK